MNQVARLAGVSLSTVSRVINKSAPVSPATRKKVMDAINLLQYRPNGVARSLVRKRTNTIGLVLPDMRNPFFAQASWVIERLASERGYSAIICNADNQPEAEIKYLNILQEREVDGIIFMNGAANQPQTFARLYELYKEVPIVLFDKKLTEYDIPSVTVDNVKGGIDITTYLIRMGHERIAFATSRFTSTERDRELGYRRALETCGMKVDNSLVLAIDEEKWKKGDLKLDPLFHRNEPITAVFASNDFKALCLYQSIRNLGLCIPEDVSVVGYDDIDMARIVFPSLTTMRQPIEAMAIEAVTMLFTIISGQTLSEQHKVFRAEIIERDSARRVKD